LDGLTAIFCNFPFKSEIGEIFERIVTAGSGINETTHTKTTSVAAALVFAIDALLNAYMNIRLVDI
jgi:hypothetical protein